MARLAKTSAYILALAGLGLATGLIAYYGFDDVAASVAAAGWGLLAVTLFHFLPLAVDTVGWQRIFERAYCPPFATLLWARWIGESVNTLLPVAQIGGEFVKGRLLILQRLPATRAGAYVVVDLTIGVFTQFIFTLIGIGLLVLHTGQSGVVTTAAVGAGLFLVLLAIFYLLQRRGLFGRLARAVEWAARGRHWMALVGGAERLDLMVVEVYRRPRAVLESSFWQLVAWVLGTGEVWLILYFMGQPVGLIEAFLLESLGQAVRAAGFVVPAALGVQEGGFLLLGAAVGLSPDVALALSLAKRVRELLVGLPGLFAWQIAEGRRLWRGGSGSG